MFTAQLRQRSDLNKALPMNSILRHRTWSIFTETLILILLSACTGTPSLVPVVSTSAPQVPVETSVPAAVVDTVLPEPAAATKPEIIVYASDLPSSALYELDFIDEVGSPGGKLIGLPNNGDELDPPPENDPHLTFNAQVQSGIPYRCWVHMKVGQAKGRSTANVVWVQFSHSVNQANQEVFRPGTKSYLTAQGPTQPGWTWVGCDAEGSDPLVYFQVNGEITVRIQAGAEGVGIDQFILSPGRFLNAPPSDPIVQK